jgi:hypothetical protein
LIKVYQVYRSTRQRCVATEYLNRVQADCGRQGSRAGADDLPGLDVTTAQTLIDAAGVTD